MSDSSPGVSGYASALAKLTQQVSAARFTAQRRINAELVRLGDSAWVQLVALDTGGVGSTLVEAVRRPAEPVRLATVGWTGS